MAAHEAILELLTARGPDKTICPSEAARKLGGDDGFRAHMDDVRAAAAGLADQGLIEVTQGGQAIDLRQARGPIRLRLADATPSGE